MKKLVSFLLIALVLLPGCGAKKKTVVQDKKIKLEGAQQNKTASSERKNLFLDEDVDGFEFEEESDHNAFAPVIVQDPASVKLVSLDSQTADDKAFAERRALQAQYGLKNIYFEFDRFGIQPSQKTALDHDVAAVKKAASGGKTVVVEGHACNSAGSSAYNVLLSEKRAQSVARYFVEQGVSADQLKVVGRGNEMCIIEAGNREQQAPNRRVELYVL